MKAKSLWKKLVSKEWGSKTRKYQEQDGVGKANLDDQMKAAVKEALEDIADGDNVLTLNKDIKEIN